MAVEVKFGTVLKYWGHRIQYFGVLHSVSPDLSTPGVCMLKNYTGQYSDTVLAFPSGTAGPIVELTKDVWTAGQLCLALSRGGLPEVIARIHSDFSPYPSTISLKIYPDDYSPDDIKLVKRTFCI